MNGIKLLGAGHAVPSRVMTNEDFTKIIDTSDEWIVSRTGIRERRYCTTETHLELCLQAARRALDMAGIRGEDLGVILVATLSADHLTPSTACLLQKELGAREDTICFDLNAACSGFIFGLHTAERLLAGGGRRYGLVIGGEVLSRLINFEDRGTCILFGDGAGAAVVESRADYPSIHACLGARGDAELLEVAGAETGRPSKIKMEGTAVFKFAVETVPKCIDQVLAASGAGVEDVDYFVFHQANERIIDLVVKKYKIPAEKYKKNVQRYGNTSAASVPILLGELCESGEIRPGMKVLCVGFGGGLTWGGALLEMGGAT